ncbi:hypothetical protein GCM10009872_28050 [Actinopolymorpha rutila]
MVRGNGDAEKARAFEHAEETGYQVRASDEDRDRVRAAAAEGRIDLTEARLTAQETRIRAITLWGRDHDRRPGRRRGGGPRARPVRAVRQARQSPREAGRAADRDQRARPVGCCRDEGPAGERRAARVTAAPPFG